MSDKPCPNENLKLEKQLCFALYRTTRAITQTYRPFLEEIGLTYPQYLVMLVLWEEDNLTLTHIGNKLMLDSGTLTPMIKKMESAGLLQRKRSHADEREVRILLTPQGHGLKNEAGKVPQKMGCVISLSDEKRLRMQQDLDELLQQILRK